MADQFEKIAASIPQNATAAKVTAKGVHWEPEYNMAKHWHSDTLPPMRKIPPDTAKSCADLPGKRFGRLTVIGLSDRTTKNGALWVVRCACGDYEHRKATAVRNPDNSDDMCRKCYTLELVKKRYKRLGSKGIEEFTAPAPTPKQ